MKQGNSIGHQLAREFINGEWRLSPEHSQVESPPIPPVACSGSEPFLEDNRAFFRLFLAEREPVECERLIFHLNRCFHCFEIFCEVLRDFCHASSTQEEKKA